MRSEYVELAKWCLDHVSISSQPVLLPFESALELHRSYLRDELLAGLGHYSWKSQPRLLEGVRYLPDKDCDVLLVTLNKSEKDYSESTMYQDYAISDRLFHWQSQSTVSEASQQDRGTSIRLSEVTQFSYSFERTSSRMRKGHHTTTSVLRRSWNPPAVVQ